MGGVPSLRWGVPGLRSGGGTQSQVQGGYPVSVKGKIFDTRFGLIHVQAGKKIFVGPPPPVKGKIFDTRFGLIHVQTGKKNFCRGTPPRIPRICYGYAAGGMPLAFTQEDFLVSINLNIVCNVAPCLLLAYGSGKLDSIFLTFQGFKLVDRAGGCCECVPGKGQSISQSQILCNLLWWNF